MCTRSLAAHRRRACPNGHADALDAPRSDVLRHVRSHPEGYVHLMPKLTISDVALALIAAVTLYALIHGWG